MRFKDKVVIVTGAASGLGEATVHEFAKEGAKVVLADVAAEKGLLYSEELNGQGLDTLFVQTDVSNEADVKNIVAKAVETYGRLDVMFANVGINIEADLHDLDFPSWQKIIDVNLTSVYLSNKYAIEQFLKQGTGGAIVNSGSIHSLVARDGLAPYSASKGGVKMLTQQVAARYTKEGIRANAIAPGYIQTPLINTLSPDVIAGLVNLHPAGRLGKPIEVAKTVLFLASDDASFISGITLPIDGGYTAV